jgi:hypothetical protein
VREDCSRSTGHSTYHVRRSARICLRKLSYSREVSVVYNEGAGLLRQNQIANVWRFYVILNIQKNQNQSHVICRVSNEKPHDGRWGSLLQNAPLRCCRSAEVGKKNSGLRRQEEIEEKIYMCSLPPSLPLSHPTSEIWYMCHILAPHTC